MPLAPEDVLKDLVAATEQAKTTIREAHEARAALLDVVKENRQKILTAIVSEVQEQVRELADEASSDLRTRAGGVIARLEADWRAKLGLDPA